MTTVRPNNSMIKQQILFVFVDLSKMVAFTSAPAPSKLLKLVLKILVVESVEEHCRVQNLHSKKEILNCSIILYSTHVKSQDRRAGVPDHQILIKFKNHVAQLQKVEEKLKEQTQNTNIFCDFVVSELQKNLHNNEAFISIL
jgi:hypothetical protein